MFDSARLLQHAIAHHQSGAEEKAKQLYLEVLKENPDQPDAHHNLGILTIRSHAWEQALFHLRQARDLQPRQAQYQISLIAALMESGRIREAQQAFVQACTEGCQHPALPRLARALQGVTEATPQEESALTTAFQQGDYPNAARLGQRMTRQHPGLGLGWKVFGCALRQLGRLQEAWPILRQAVAWLPDDAEAYGNLALLTCDLERWDEAEQLCRQGLTLQPGRATLFNILAIALRGQNRLPEAEESCQLALTHNPHLIEARANLGLILFEQNKTDAAKRLLQQTLEQNPTLTTAHNTLGNLHLKQKEWIQAEICYRRVLSTHPGHPESMINLIHVLLQTRQFPEAERLCQHMMAQMPEHVPALHAAGCLYRDLGRPQEAEAAWQRILALQPDHVESLIQLGNLLPALGKTDQAHACLEQAVILLTSETLEPHWRAPSPHVAPKWDRSLAYETLQQARERLLSAGIPFFLVLGTLLGVMRENRLLPHDKDLDIGLPWEIDRDRVIALLCREGLFREECAPWYGTEQRQWQIGLRHRNGTVLDLLFHKPDGESHYLCGFHAFPQPILSRPRRFSIGTHHWHALDWPIPAPAEGYLSDYYGPNWRTPDPEFHTVLCSHCRLPESMESRWLFGWFRLIDALKSRNPKKAQTLCRHLLALKSHPLLQHLLSRLV